MKEYLNGPHIAYNLARHLKIDADPDLVPDLAYHFDKDPDANPDFYLMRMRIRIHNTSSDTTGYGIVSILLTKAHGWFFLLAPDRVGDGKVGILQLKLAVLRGQFRYGNTRLVRVRHG